MDDIESEKDKNIEELLKRKAELESRFTQCSTRLSERIDRINKQLVQTKNIAEPSVLVARGGDSSMTVPYFLSQLSHRS